MEKLNDYSGKMRPDLKLSDFSEEALRKLFKVSADLYIGMSQRWARLVKEELGEQKAIELGTKMWMERGGCDDEIKLNREAMNILGDDVESVFKYLQIDIGFTPNIQFEAELKNKNHGIMTVTNCKYLNEAMERGKYTSMKHACEVIDVLGFDICAKAFNPRMKSTALALPEIPPPPEGYKGVICQWEFKVEA